MDRILAASAAVIVAAAAAVALAAQDPGAAPPQAAAPPGPAYALAAQDHGAAPPQAAAPPGPAHAQARAELSLAEIFESVEAGTVSVEASRPSALADRRGAGSGFVFDKMGHVITNAHVVDGASRVVVTFLDGRSYVAEAAGVDAFTDIAVLRVGADPDALQPLRIGDSSQLRVGQPIAAIGNPFGLSGSMTSGIVSQLGRLLPSYDTPFQIPGVIQTDAAINPGNSGGPLLNMRGEVVGINTAIRTDTGLFNGVGFAVPSQTLAKIVPRLISDGSYSHPWIGVTGADMGPELAELTGAGDTRGFLVIDVASGSPADRAGLRGADRVALHDGREYRIGGDIIVGADGMPVRSINDILLHLQRSKSVGDEVALDLVRGGAPASAVVALEGRPER